VRALLLFDFCDASPKKQSEYVYLRAERHVSKLVKERERAEGTVDALARVLLDARPVELLPLPVAAPVLVERFTGLVALALGPADLVDELAVGRARAEEVRVVRAGEGRRDGRVDDAGAREELEEGLLVAVVGRAPLVGEVVLDAKDCERAKEGGGRSVRVGPRKGQSGRDALLVTPEVSGWPTRRLTESMSESGSSLSSCLSSSSENSRTGPSTSTGLVIAGVSSASLASGWA